VTFREDRSQHDFGRVFFFTGFEKTLSQTSFVRTWISGSSALTLLCATSSSVRLVSRAMLTGMRLMEVEYFCTSQYVYFCTSEASKELCQGGEVCDAHGNAAGGVGAYVFILQHT